MDLLQYILRVARLSDLFDSLELFGVFLASPAVVFSAPLRASLPGAAGFVVGGGLAGARSLQVVDVFLDRSDLVIVRAAIFEPVDALLGISYFLVNLCVFLGILIPVLAAALVAVAGGTGFGVSR